MNYRLRSRSALAVALAVFVAVAWAAVALAVAPIKGATYKGKLKLPRAATVSFAVSFKVSATGKRVGNFKLPNGYPVYCQGGGFGQMHGASGSISRKGSFKVKLPIIFAPSHQHQGFVIVSGTFARHGKASGKVVTDFTVGSGCNGTSRYTAKA